VLFELSFAVFRAFRAVFRCLSCFTSCLLLSFVLFELSFAVFRAFRAVFRCLSCFSSCLSLSFANVRIFADVLIVLSFDEIIDRLLIGSCEHARPERTLNSHPDAGWSIPISTFLQTSHARMAGYNPRDEVIVACGANMIEFLRVGMSRTGQRVIEHLPGVYSVTNRATHGVSPTMLCSAFTKTEFSLTTNLR